MKHILSKSLHIAASPGKLVSHPLKRVFEKSYRGQRFARTLFVVDIIVLAAIATATAIILYFTVFRPARIVDLVHVDATVAPTEVVSGDLSTLIIRYENTSSEPLRYARLNLGFPAHFELKEVQSEFPELSAQTYDLDTIEPGETGSIKLRGVMFGDVGGTQTFVSTLNFAYGERNKAATKTSEHTFSPVRSTLALALTLPERLIAGQQVRGVIRYKNTGTIDFPEISIEPVWPEGFELVSGTFNGRALKAGEEGTLEFVGRLSDQESIDFVFHPSFTFGEDRYTQETLTSNVQVLPSQVTATTTFDATNLTPGGQITATVTYQHVGEFPVRDFSINLNTINQPLFQKPVYAAAGPIVKLDPGDQGSVTVTMRLNPTIDARSLSTFTNLTATVKTYVNYRFGDDAEVLAVLTDSDTLAVTSPIILESFGRYTSPQGDQIGRGPLPPLVGEETKYWVFMTIRGTTSALENVKMEADLGPGVQFTGKQSVSVGESLNYDSATHSVTWTIGSLPPTLAPGSQVVSVAFEVSLTPSDAMTGTTPTLLSSPLVTARDTFTGAFVTARGANITTNLPHDQMAAGMGVVEE